MELLLICVIAGALGGLIKSLLEHKGIIIFPSTAEVEGRQVLVLGTLYDVIGGGVIGAVSSHEMVYSFFGSSEPNFALAFFLGLAWMPVIQAILNKLGIKENSSANSNSLKRNILPLILA